jgi:hypothetical protein
MQAEIDKEVHIKFEGGLTDLLISVDESYSRCVTFEQGKKVVYALLNKALYNTVQAGVTVVLDEAINFPCGQTWFCLEPIRTLCCQQSFEWKSMYHSMVRQ